MKKLVVLVAVMALFLFPACQQDEILNEVTKMAITPVMKLQIKSQPELSVKLTEKLIVAKKDVVGPLSKDKVLNIISGLNLKSAQDENPDYEENIMVIVKRQDPNISYIENNRLFVFSIYWVIDLDSHKRIDEITLIQGYDILSDGTFDTSSFTFDFEFGTVNYFRRVLDKVSNVYDVSCRLRMDDGKQYYYKLDYYNGELLLPQMENGKWQITGKGVSDSGMDYKFMSSLIDPYDNLHIIPVIIQFKEENVKSYIQIPKEMIKGVDFITVIGRKENGLHVYFDIEVSYTDELPNLIEFPVTLKQIVGVTICKKWSGCWYYDTEAESVDIKTGITTFVIRQ